MHLKKILLPSLIIAVLSQGCATNSLLKLQEADFSRNGVVTGRLLPDGSPGNWYYNSVHLKDAKQSTKYFLNWAHRTSFFAEVPPGKYVLYVGEMVSRSGYNSFKTVTLKAESTPFWVEAGEAVYLGDISFSFHKTSGPDYKKASTWIGLMAGVTESKGKVHQTIRDKYARSETFLKEALPMGGYRHTKKLISFAKNRTATDHQEITNEDLFIDVGVAEKIDVSKLRYEVKGKAKEFEAGTNKIVWYALPNQDTRKEIQNTELVVELLSPDKNVVATKVAKVANDLGLLVAEFDLSGERDALGMEGQWLTQVLVGETTNAVLFEFKN